MNNEETYSSIINKIKEDVNFIKCFPENYFSEDFKVLFKLVLYFSGNSNHMIKGIDIENKYPHLTWAYYHIQGIIAYSKNNYSEGIISFQNAVEVLFQDFNIKRIIYCKINICAMYNRLESYRDSIKISSTLIEYIIFQTENISWKKHSIMHYLMALLMIDNYDKILYFYINLNEPSEVLTDISAMVGIIASYKKKVKGADLNTHLKECIKQRKYARYVYNHLYRREEMTDEIKNKFEDVYYLKKIKSKL